MKTFMTILGLTVIGGVAFMLYKRNAEYKKFLETHDQDESLINYSKSIDELWKGEISLDKVNDVRMGGGFGALALIFSGNDEIFNDAWRNEYE